MLYKIETSTGSISIAKNVIGRIVIQAVKKFKGNVMISNHKGKVHGLVKKIGDGDAINNMDITMGENGLDLRIYVVLNFGTSIGNVTNQLIEEIYTRIKAFTGAPPNSVAIIVTGILANQQMARRNIEVKR